MYCICDFISEYFVRRNEIVFHSACCFYIQVFKKIKEGSTLLQVMRKRKRRSWLGHILRVNAIQTLVFEGKKKRGSRLKLLVDIAEYRMKTWMFKLRKGGDGDGGNVYNLQHGKSAYGDDWKCMIWHYWYFSYTWL